MVKSRTLPQYIEPMLAKPGVAFDSSDYLFEVKWDGTRSIAYIERDGYRLMNRRGIEMSDRYPDLAFLGKLPAGTILDGEIVVLTADGKPSFNALQRREQARSALNVQMAARSSPATYMVFDQLYDRFISLLDHPLAARRERLRKTVEKARHARLVMSRGTNGSGTAFFAEVVNAGLEGIIAKRSNSRYSPGKRTGAWIKIKRQETITCAVIGFIPEGKDDLAALIVAAEVDGAVRYVGKVGSGFDTPTREAISLKLRARVRSKPVVACPIKGIWVEPGLYCHVRYMERTKNGQLRGPVFAGIYAK